MIKRIYPDINCMPQIKLLEQILREVASKHEVPVYMIKSNQRFQELVDARTDYAKRAFEVTKDHSMIAELIGRDRSTIYHYLNERA